MTTEQLPGGDPLWYKDAIIYQLHVKAFYDSNEDGIGDFRGLISKLDYLQDLGVTCVWLLPFYPSPLRDDGYDIADYFGVHPAYGTLRDFRQFVREAHQRGIRVITEIVINHTSDAHPWFQAARSAAPGSNKRDFYVWSDTDEKYKEARIIFTDTETSNWTWDPEAKAYYWHRFFHHQPDLNFDNPQVRKAVTRVMRHWLDMGIDGVRLDAIPYLVEREGTNCENLPETHEVLRELRHEVDKHYTARMLLAEANQWPADVRPYFGDGDECHMAFHFPLMPRIFMALRQEDRHAIIEIMQQTPEIPEECQWALFLRNHDELTLEMVTDEERDYMYREYAADPQARLNLGIRRRLAPLLGNSRARMQLLTSLLFSFPGTPLIYYGDEIGMGDNIYLGDRNGVRTPMQWSADRNAGFSRADFSKLYAPLIMDLVYGYQAINVEAQQRDPSSLLNWMKHLIALRKRYTAFGRGTMEFVHPANRKVLAYIRRHGDEIILAAANLSRFVQPAELNLSKYQGLTPIELFGRVRFPPIGELPYFLTLAPHSFYWFSLEYAPEEISINPLAPATEDLPSVAQVSIPGGFLTLLEGPTRAYLERNVLPKFIARQRWFGAKGHVLQNVTIRDWAVLCTEPLPVFLFVIETFYDDGGSDLYSLPMAITHGPAAEAMLIGSAPGVIARVRGPHGEGVLHDALIEPAACRELLKTIRNGARQRTHLGQLSASTTPAFADICSDVDLDAVPIELRAAEQSNSLVLFGDRLILKMYRHLEPGLNPEFEIGKHLTERTDFARAPRLGGAIEYQPSRRTPTTYALLSEFIPNQGNAWQHTLSEISQYFERAYSHAFDETPDMNGRSLLDVANAEPSERVLETIGPSLRAAAILGQRTAELHAALSAEEQDPAFVPEAITRDDVAATIERFRRQARSALDCLEHNLHEVAEPLRPVVDRLRGLDLARTRQWDHLLEVELNSTKIRCHGDFHLGQLLWVENDFYIIDFEGEPQLPLAERRIKQSPLKDVAGMLRSFDYAAQSGLHTFAHDRPSDFERLRPWARTWQLWVSGTYLNEYRLTAAGASFLPDDPGHFLDLLRLFLLEKALYELQYELNNRPDWVGIPLAGIMQLTGADPITSSQQSPTNP